MHIKKLIFYILCLLFLQQALFSQTSFNYDSLNEKITEPEFREETFQYLANKAKSKEVFVDSLIDLGLNFAEKYDIEKWRVEFYLLKSSSELTKTKVNSGITYALEALQIIKQKNSYELKKGWAHNNIAKGLAEIRAYDQAIFHKQQQLLWAKQHNYTIRQAEIASIIGNYFLKLEKPDSSLFYYRKAYLLSVKGRETKTKVLAGRLNSLGWAFLKNNQLDSANTYFTKAYSLLKTTSLEMLDSLLLGTIIGNLSQTLPIEGNEKKVEELLKEDIQMSKNAKAYLSVSNAYLALAKLKIGLKQFEEGKFFLERSTESVNKAKNNDEAKEQRLRILKGFMLLYKSKDDLKKELLYTQKYIDLKDSLYSKKRINDLLNSISEYQLAGINKELELKKLY